MTLESDDVAFLRGLCGGDGLSGPGDDAALLRMGGRVLVTVDPVVEGRHYDPGTPPGRVARKLVNRNYSDLAAMGAWPRAVVASLCFGPGWRRPARRHLYRGILAAVEKFGARWVGGDVAATGGPSVFTVCALGEPCGRRVVTRAGLRPGDHLFVSGRLGRSLASGRHLTFEPRLEIARRLVERHEPTAMIDVSDGLARDLSRLLAASGGCGARLVARAIPRYRGASLDDALFDGEDHELLFGVRPRRVAALAADEELPAVCRRSIGRAERGGGLRVVRSGGGIETIDPKGFDHVLP